MTEYFSERQLCGSKCWTPFLVTTHLQYPDSHELVGTWYKPLYRKLRVTEIETTPRFLSDRLRIMLELATEYEGKVASLPILPAIELPTYNRIELYSRGCKPPRGRFIKRQQLLAMHVEKRTIEKYLVVAGHQYFENRKEFLFYHTDWTDMMSRRDFNLDMVKRLRRLIDQDLHQLLRLNAATIGYYQRVIADRIFGLLLINGRMMKRDINRAIKRSRYSQHRIEEALELLQEASRIKKTGRSWLEVTEKAVP